MKLVITGKNLDMGESLRSRIEERIATGVERLFDGSVKSQVVIEKQRGFFHCECTLNLPTGLTLQAHGRGADAHAAFDEAASHLERQLKRYKKRLRDHQQSRTEPVRAFAAASYVIAGSGEESPEPDSLSPPSLPRPPPTSPSSRLEKPSCSSRSPTCPSSCSETGPAPDSIWCIAVTMAI